MSAFCRDREGWEPRGFIPDVKTWFLETDHREEAYYLAAVLNSGTMNEFIKPYQPRGLYGPRAIHRRPLLLGIPEYSANHPDHSLLATLGERCSSKVLEAIRANPKLTRAAVKQLLHKELEKIDQLTLRVVGDLEG